MFSKTLVQAPLDVFFGRCLAYSWLSIWRAIGPSTLFGQYSIIFNYFLLLQQAPLLGLHILLARDAAARPDDRRSEMVTAGSLGLVVSVPLAIGVGMGCLFWI
jgi:hypothetical protein